MTCRMHISHERWMQPLLAWAVLELLGSVLVGGCMPRYRLVRVYPETENHLQAAQKLLLGGNYSAAAAEYEWVALSQPALPLAQESQVWARTLRQLLSLQQELSKTNEKLNNSRRDLDGLKRKGSGLEGKAQKLEEDKQKLEEDKQKLEENNQKLKVEIQELQQEIQKFKESYIRLEKLERDLKRGKSEVGVPGR